MDIPHNQDCYAVALIHYVGALEDVIDGRFDEWIAKCGTQWASLPHSPLNDGGSKVAYARASDVWKRHGGSVPVVISRATDDRTDAPAPVEERSTQARPEDVERINQSSPQDKPMAPLLILPLLQSLLEVFSPIVRAKVTRALDKQGADAAAPGQVADNLMGIARTLRGRRRLRQASSRGQRLRPAAIRSWPSLRSSPIPHSSCRQRRRWLTTW